MITGLLGEHLASPRTASQTNQITALESKTATGGETSSGEDFASMVADETNPTPTSSGPTDDAAAVDLTPNSAAITSQPETVEPREATTTLADPASLLNSVDSDFALETKDTPADPKDILPVADADALTVAETDAPKAPVAVSTVNTDIESDLIADPSADSPKLRTDGGQSPELKTAEATPQTVKLTETLEVKGDPEVAQVNAETPRANLPTKDAEITPRTTPQLAAQAPVTDVSGLAREAPIAVTTAEPVVTVGPTHTGISAPAATPSGLTPIAPSIPIASPNELTGIILNAVQNGLNSQEQLVVQLDPPELGRVMIDFKFDAQGLQQIVVTSENPEALKRLREMHLELTEALRDQGLSDKNMSFRDQSEERRESARSSSDFSERELSYSRSEEPTENIAVRSPEPRVTTRTRLDLVL
ncbi:MAG: flagellar hook-length control protein FliK [Pseudomonadota bacterium]